MFLRNGASNYTRLGKDIAATQSSGAMANTQFVAEDLREFKVEATTFEEKPAETPFDPTSDLPVW